MRKNCSSDQEKLLKFEAKGREFAKCLRSQKQKVKHNAFLTCFWRFLRYYKLEQLEFKLERIIWIKKHAGKVRKRKMFCLDFKDMVW